MKKLNIWLIKTGEPFLGNADGDRLLRMGLLAESLIRRGHNVTWFSSDFDHFRKKFHSKSLFLDDGVEVEGSCNYNLVKLKSIGYKKNTSIRRLIDHWILGKRLYKKMKEMDRPDVIVSAYPTAEFCFNATKFALKNNIPVIIDIRDLFPDTIVDQFSGITKSLLKILSAPFYSKASYCFRNATSLVAITNEFLSWGQSLGKRILVDRDKFIPMGYSSKVPTKNDLLNANEYWDSLGVDTNMINVCFFGTIGDYFNFTPIVNVSKVLLGKPIRFILCGDGPRMEELKKLVGKSDNIILPGWVNHSQIYSLMKRSKVGIAPYINIDNFSKNIPNKIVEYMSEGLVIVSSINGVIGNIIKGDNFGYCYDSEDDLSLILNSIVEDNMLDQMRERSRTCYEDNFIAEKKYLEYAEFIENACDSKF